ncbi:putative MFS family arabinose efflux permease [Nocardiopsis sp. Huas11]|uniref:MFS transporter n=1 Tax=Nocardiopsis sp. Huas11 TaxID=2183912 RepID=UPI000F0E1F0F|nr:MFS transporter [Nocardiopsis sp. Huas11]RKS08222.1 putative MFS family arabinose efflux permease [Nocardiopsis sp. Huas11]
MSTRRGGWRLHFGLLWAGGALSSLGSITLGLAFPLLALHQTGSPVVAGCVAAMGMVPRTLLHIPIGLLVDRGDPRTVMIAGLAVRVVCVLGLVGPVLWLDAPVALLGAAAAVHGVCATCHATAATTAVPYLIPHEELTGAAAKNEARGHAAQLAGRPLGGGLFGLAHALPAVCDAVVSLVALVLALRLPRIRPDRAAAGRTRLLHDLALGFTQLGRDRFLLLTAVACTVTNALFQMIWLVILMLATQEGLSPLLLGVVLAASGAGGLIGSLVAPFTVSRRSPATMVTLCLWGWAAVTLLLAATDHSDVARLLVVLPLTWSGVGFVGAHINVTVLTYHSQNVPPEVLGRVTSTLRFFTGAALPVGVVSGGFLLDALGVRGTTLAVTGVIVALAVLFTVLTPPPPSLLRRLVRSPHSRARPAPGRASPRSGAAARPTRAGPGPPPPRDLSPSARE